ncbi:MAG: ribosome maturation factor RimM [Candidatus Adiutrix sp.]|jgi:16S rRNA processing protein RimM|nr:ribosome maturation factor RimM [Candidatus Adiutrix sp.]
MPSELYLKDAADFIALGHIARAHGVQGAVLIAPYTDNIGLILAGQGLLLASPGGGSLRPAGLLTGRAAAQGLIVKLQNVTTREAAAALRGWRIGLSRADLPPAEADEYYLADLLGLEVLTAEGEDLGVVAQFMEAGAGLILVVASAERPGRERLIPDAFVVRVDLAERRLIVDPPAGLLDL